jgi:hypothetical protein
MTTIPLEVIAAVALLAAAGASIGRLRTARKWRKLIDAYADQEIAREWRRHSPANIRPFSFSRRGEHSPSRRNVHARSGS